MEPQGDPLEVYWEAAFRIPARRKRQRWARLSELPPLERLFAQQVIAEDTSSVDSDRYYRNGQPCIPPDLQARARRLMDPWISEWLEPHEIEGWLAIGMRSAEVAAACKRAGVTPAMLMRPYCIPGKPLCGGSVTLKGALDRQLATVEEIRAELVRTGLL
jgi:hypothetical protein